MCRFLAATKRRPSAATGGVSWPVYRHDAEFALSARFTGERKPRLRERGPLHLIATAVGLYLATEQGDVIYMGARKN